MTEEIHHWTTMVGVVGETAFDLLVAVLNIGLCFDRDTYCYVANLYYLKNSSNSKIIYVTIKFYQIKNKMKA